MPNSIELCFGSSTRRNTDSSMGGEVLVMWLYGRDRRDSLAQLCRNFTLPAHYRHLWSASKALFPRLKKTAFPYIEDRICPLQTALMQKTRSTEFEPWTIVIWGDIEMLGDFSSPMRTRALGTKMVQFWPSSSADHYWVLRLEIFMCVWLTSDETRICVDQ